MGLFLEFGVESASISDRSEAITAWSETRRLWSEIVFHCCFRIKASIVVSLLVSKLLIDFRVYYSETMVKLLKKLYHDGLSFTALTIVVQISLSLYTRHCCIVDKTDSVEMKGFS